MRLIFNGERWPALGLVVVVVTIDALHAFGNVLLVSNVLPQVRKGGGFKFGTVDIGKPLNRNRMFEVAATIF